MSARLWFVNTRTDLDSLADAVSGDVAVVLLNVPQFMYASGSPVAWSELRKQLVTPGTLVVGDGEDPPT